MEIVFGIILLVAAVFLVIAVLMQNGKSKRLSGTIAGGADTFFGKTKGKTASKVLSKVTTVVAIVFTLIVLAAYLVSAKQYNDAKDVINSIQGHVHEETVATETVAETAAPDAE